MTAEAKKIKAFDVWYPTENKFEMIKGLILHYVVMEFSMGRIKSIPSQKLITFLVYYVQYGYSYDTKDKIRRFCNYKDMQSVDQVNLKLKNYGFLIESVMSKKEKLLNTSLSALREYVLDSDSSKYVIRSIIHLDGRSEEV